MNTCLNRLFLLLLLSGVTAGCQPEATSPSSAQAVQSEVKETREPLISVAYPVTVTDYRGQDVTIQSQPQRIISLMPAHTEILFAIGAGEQLVGCTSLCNYPPETKSLKKIAFANPGSISLEALVELQPDLIILGGDYHRLLAEQLEKIKVPVLSFESQSLADIEKSILGIAKATGHTDRGKQIIHQIKEDIQAIQERVKPFQEQGRPRVFYQVWDQPLMTAGPESFIGELITLVGGDNIFGDLKIAYPQVSEETLVVRNPDVILLPGLKNNPQADARQAIATLKQRPGWDKMNAVKNQRIYIIEDDLISRPGPRVVQGLQNVAQALYPEAFPKP
ncbi:ABC transporter substrate-binding protein [Gimesia maris]|uniref:Vitamin B12-binding protein n=1 Tax=Gimesia maris TaxID=122 RepID=A0ABX5YGY7_9PLAN|nr:cobalamin-binding protein [Gimesia maris]EDL61597.1 periplasmic binding protein [Gimesia maris DSM 8797]QEG15006.1 Vitamin B12-binding protein precursor [Gimesia maris]QGQ31628.1 cobalamin-binding protein [Gimesia maris]